VLGAAADGSMFGSAFAEIAAILLLAAVVGGLAHLLRQPLIIAYIAVGILVGPALGIVSATDEVTLLAEVGIALLLFLVGLKLDLHLIRTTGPVALVTGLGQVIFTSVVGFGIAIALGFDVVPALYIAVALTFSSTIIIVKLLSDKRELDELHGRIAVGFLIVQDLVVIIAMIVITAVGDRGDGDAAVATEVLATGARGVLFVVAIALLARYVLTRLLDRLARMPELVVLFGVAWAVAVAAASDYLGLSMEVGAFLAGVSLASTAYREALGARLVSLRDILILFFFIDLGSTMEFSDAVDQIWPALLLSAFVLIGNPLIVMIVMGLMGYRKQVSFLSGLAVAQISEFSLILTALGLSLGHIESPVLGLVTVVGVITIGLSTYLILYSKQIYERIAPLLSVFERSNPTKGEGAEDSGHPYDAVVVGAGRFGGAVVEGMRQRGDRLLLVDYDPQVLTRWRDRNVDTLYGDISEPELAGALPLGEVHAVVCTVPELSANLVLLEAVRSYGYTGLVALTAHTQRDADALSGREGVLVLHPLAEAASQMLPRLTGKA
jgi:Kef-type K+ transport system membrane component KefB